MTICHQDGPADGYAQAADMHDRCYRKPGFWVSTYQPMRHYGMGLDRIVSEDWTAMANADSWIYMQRNQEDENTLVQVQVLPSGASKAVSFSHPGHWVNGVAAALDLAHKLFIAAPEAYEVRILDIPALHVTAVWLKGDRDIFIPCAAAPAVDADFKTKILRMAIDTRAAYARAQKKGPGAPDMLGG